MNSQNTVLIISAELSKLSGAENLKRTAHLTSDLLALRKSGAIDGFQQAKGVYTHLDGSTNEECSFVVNIPFKSSLESVCEVISLAFNKYAQESVLELNYKREATLVLSNGKFEKLGKLELMKDNETALNYTKLADNRCYTARF